MQCLIVLFNFLLLFYFTDSAAAQPAADAIAKRAVGGKGVLLCGKKPIEGVIIRLFRVAQSKKDDLNQILDEKLTGVDGSFHIDGNTNGFPLNETTIDGTLTFYHSCDEDKEKVKKNGYRKFNYHIPQDYVSYGSKPKKHYDLGYLNLQLEFPEEKHEKNFKEYVKASVDW
ncbi:unnamed protein product, partial [Mesorhabditis belari]|uniref:Uncharacterized protein n=1 Tax=Mesorhabditis belari TaxID=2138241 RepID=A0AAF3J7I3_9BILA